MECQGQAIFAAILGFVCELLALNYGIQGLLQIVNNAIYSNVE